MWQCTFCVHRQKFFLQMFPGFFVPTQYYVKLRRARALTSLSEGVLRNIVYFRPKFGSKYAYFWPKFGWKYVYFCPKFGQKYVYFWPKRSSICFRDSGRQGCQPDKKDCWNCSLAYFWMFPTQNRSQTGEQLVTISTQVMAYNVWNCVCRIYTRAFKSIYTEGRSPKPPEACLMKCGDVYTQER